MGLTLCFGTSVQALEVSGQFQARSVYGLVLDKELFSEFIASIELSQSFDFLPGATFKLKLDPSFQFDKGKTRLGTFERSGLDEAFIGYSAERWDLKVGMQKLAWGRGDGIVPNDIINPKDRTRFLTDSELEQKLGNFMVRASYYGQSGTVEAVWIPRFKPDRFPSPSDPFFPPTLNVLPSVTLAGFPIPTEVDFLPDEIPRPGFKRSELGLRMAATFGPLDSQLYLFFGYDRQAIYTPQPHFFLETLPSNLSLVDLLDSEARIDVLPRHPPIWQIGMDVTSTLGPLVIRGEAAFLQGRRFNWDQSTSLDTNQLNGLLGSPQTNIIIRSNIVEIILPDLVSEKDSAQFLVGLDYPVPAFENWELFVSSQLIQQRIYDIDVPLVYKARETSATALVRLSRSDGIFQIEGAANFNITRIAYLLEGSIAYRFNDHWKARLSAISIGGSKGSLIADFQALDLGNLELSYFW